MPVIGGAAALLLTAAVVASVLWRSGDGPAAPTPTPPPTPPASPRLTIAVTIDGGARWSSDHQVEVAVDTPASSSSVQLSNDPTFADAEWRPIAPAYTVDLPDSGYQMVFVRARDHDDRSPTAVGVAGITIDPGRSAAIATAHGGRAQPSSAGLVSTTTLQVHVETGRVDTGTGGGLQMVGDDRLGPIEMDAATSYVLDPTGVSPTSVSRITRPIGFVGRTPALSHDLFLTFAEPIPTDTPLTLTFGSLPIAPLVTEVGGAHPSPAVHVNQIGFAPSDGGKLAIVSGWTGYAGAIDMPEMDARLIDATGATVWQGRTTARRRPANGERQGRDLSGADAQVVDFSGFTQVGTFRACVTPLGCSEPFDISPTSTWRRALVAVARSAYHQRSNEALGPPYTAVERPAAFPQGGSNPIHRVRLTILDDPSRIGRDDRFDEYGPADTGEEVAPVPGWHFDAGDWNTSVRHLDYLDAALDLYEYRSEDVKGIDLAIPESTDAIPDLLDEGLIDLDLYLSLQGGDGGVPGAIDMSRYPGPTETSWRNDLRTFAYAPDVYSSYRTAATAARAAHALAGLDASRAARYEDAATRAIAWADAQLAATTPDPAAQSAIDGARSRAATAMLELTGDPRWNDVVLDIAPFADGPIRSMNCDPGDACTAAWDYARLDPALTTPALRQDAVDSIVAHADQALQAQGATVFELLTDRGDTPLAWGLGPSSPAETGVLRAFVLTGDERYRTAAVMGASFGLGANPLNTSFCTGLGERPVLSPLTVDVSNGGLPVWPGTCVFGVFDLSSDESAAWYETDYLDPAGTTPRANEVPLLWSWYDTSVFAGMNEYTYGHSHATALWVLGVLALSGI